MVLKRFKKHLFVLFLSILVIPNVKAEIVPQKMNIVLRSIAHEFLLQIGDQSSQILPVEIIDGRYAIRFENNFAYEPDMLMFASLKTLEQQGIPESFIVEVEPCESKEIIHAFETNLKDEKNMQPCRGRTLPEDCYVFYFTIDGQTDGIPLTEKKSSGAIVFYVLLGLTLLVFSIYLFKRYNRNKSNSNLIDIGQYQYDQKGMLLKLKSKTIELSSKESDLLYLLFKHENKTLEREYILREIWADEGDYVGRTLDVFISKLRKKIAADPNLKIVNVRGVGYRFVMQ